MWLDGLEKLPMWDLFLLDISFFEQQFIFAIDDLPD